MVLTYLLPLALGYKVVVKLSAPFTASAVRSNTQIFSSGLHISPRGGSQSFFQQCVWTLTPSPLALTLLLQLLWGLDRTNLRILFLTQVRWYKEHKGVYQSRDTGPSNSASKTTKARYTWSKFWVACMYLTSSIASSHHSTGQSVRDKIGD